MRSAFRSTLRQIFSSLNTYFLENSSQGDDLQKTLHKFDAIFCVQHMFMRSYLLNTNT